MHPFHSDPVCPFHTTSSVSCNSFSHGSFNVRWENQWFASCFFSSREQNSVAKRWHTFTVSTSTPILSTVLDNELYECTSSPFITVTPTILVDQLHKTSLTPTVYTITPFSVDFGCLDDSDVTYSYQILSSTLPTQPFITFDAANIEFTINTNDPLDVSVTLVNLIATPPLVPQVN